MSDGQPDSSWRDQFCPESVERSTSPCVPTTTSARPFSAACWNMSLRRTGAASALAASYLARADARTLLVVGTGALAPFMAHAHCALRPIARVLVWGRHPDRAARLAATLAAEGLPATAVATLDEGLAGADIVTCATTANATSA